MTGEFAVMDIQVVEWSNTLFEQLVIPKEYKDFVMASAKTRLGVAEGPRFDDIVSGKERA
jgi:hypothetical protein